MNAYTFIARGRKIIKICWVHLLWVRERNVVFHVLGWPEERILVDALISDRELVELLIT